MCGVDVAGPIPFVPSIPVSPDPPGRGRVESPMSKIYTKTGDAGTTGLLASRRVSKDDARIEAYGTIDELNAVLGTARAALSIGEPIPRPPGDSIDLDGVLGRIQNDLFSVGAALADPNPEGPFHNFVKPDDVARLESWIDLAETELEPLTHFILPGGTAAAAHLHVARTVCRRAERRVVHLHHQPGEAVAAPLIVYINRLSDLLFVLARLANRRAGVEDVVWSAT